MMPAHSHNLLETYYKDSGNTFHYNSLRSDEADEDTFRVDFTREVTGGGINVTIINIAGNAGAPVLDTDRAALATEVNSLQGTPLNGDECITLGWTYLGHIRSNADNINNARATAASAGYEFVSLYYTNGYFVYGCKEQKSFYEQG